MPGAVAAAQQSIAASRVTNYPARVHLCQSQQGRENWPSEPRQVPDFLDRLIPPAPSSCHSGNERPGRLRVICGDVNCLGRHGQRRWTWLGRADRKNPMVDQRGNDLTWFCAGAGIAEVRLHCGRDFVLDIWHAAPTECEFNV